MAHFNEVKRQLMHILTGVIISFFYYKGYVTSFDIWLATFVFALVFISNHYKKIPQLEYLLNHLERDSVRFRGFGAVFFLLGSALATTLFTKNIALASIMIITFGDSIATLLGPYGSLPYINSRKTVEGLIIAAITGAVTASLFVRPMYALIASTVSMLIEGLDIHLSKYKFDDNVLIPLVSGLVLTLLISL